MSVVTIYMEGGGDDDERQAALRTGMESFLQRGMADGASSLRVVPCGGRSDAFARFRRAVVGGQDRVAVLLVDSEQRVTVATARAHLLQRPEDGWDLSFATEDRVHLMIQTMETWIVADGQALALYYGEGFDQDQLPDTDDLEAVRKQSVLNALKRATESSARKRFHKVWHARDMLAKIDPETVQTRCPACRRLFETLAKEIGRR